MEENTLVVFESYEDVSKFMGKNEIQVSPKDDCTYDAYAYAIEIGRVYKDGTIKSFFKKDIEDKSTEIFDLTKKTLYLKERYRSLFNRETKEEYSVTSYYVPYKRKDHCSEYPTVLNKYVDCISNCTYTVKYEIVMVADEEFRKYITGSYSTDGTFSSGFYDAIVSNLEYMFEEWFEEEENGFNVNEFNDKTIRFYNEFGEDIDVEIYSIAEALRMVTSVRVIGLDVNIIDEY